MRILFLDDDKHRHEKFARETIGHIVQHCWTVAAGIKCLEDDPQYDLVCLDHDMGHQLGMDSCEADGCRVAAHIAKSMLPENRPKMVVVHSYNPDGAREMVFLLKECYSIGETLIAAPFGSFKVRG